MSKLERFFKGGNPDLVRRHLAKLKSPRLLAWLLTQGELGHKEDWSSSRPIRNEEIENAVRRRIWSLDDGKIVELLQSTNPKARSLTAAALLEAKRARKFAKEIAEHCVKHQDTGVKNTGMWVLKHFRKLPQGIVQTIAEQLNHRDEKVRREAAIALWDMKAREQLPALEKAIKREQSSSLTQSTIANAIIHIENSARTHAFLKANGINPERFKGTGPLPLPRFVKK